MVTLKKAVIAGIGTIVVGLGVAAPADADPADDPCQLAATFLCRLIPTAPDLDHDIDLTQDSAVINGQQLPEMPSAGQHREDAPPVDICANGCV
ncbi:fibronectin-binding protein [Mycolicibacter kumamotonensis]|uniref:Fibronectin-binding protein n=1 Tax=Mycolicibacter kumamotonensis TaxID=354243 RepID=A0A7K3L672_9MYCO|nr:fibronectin-binding protein [Mycolicibacter kumamotonensis]NDJ87924.1 fibronectin-binding protein [Mycolicibacter kumamotonensis]